MCGRARATLSADAVASVSGTHNWVHRDSFSPRYNAAPGTVLPVLRIADPKRGEPKGTRCVESMTWGLVPSWTESTQTPDYYAMFNARGETLSEKPAFSRLLTRKRCVVFIDGFYEWKTEGAGALAVKQPYYLYLKASDMNDMKNVDTSTTLNTHTVTKQTATEKPLRCAALYDVWRRDDNNSDSKNNISDHVTFAIITVSASEKIRWLHDRMPAILRSDTEVSDWLGGNESTAGSEGLITSERTPYESLLRPYNESDLIWHPVTTELNTAGKMEGPACCAKVTRAVEKNTGNILSMFAKQKEKGHSIKLESPKLDLELESAEKKPTAFDKLFASSPAHQKPTPSPPPSTKKRKKTNDATQTSVAELFGKYK